jgi:hypothetical protein
MVKTFNYSTISLSFNSWYRLNIAVVKLECQIKPGAGDKKEAAPEKGAALMIRRLF